MVTVALQYDLPRDVPLVGVGLLNDLEMIHYRPLLHQMNSNGDGRLLHQR
jgi:hypothetical protein